MLRSGTEQDFETVQAPPQGGSHRGHLDGFRPGTIKDEDFGSGRGWHPRRGDAPGSFAATNPAPHSISAFL
jgi:hypothetical protein